MARRVRRATVRMSIGLVLVAAVLLPWWMSAIPERLTAAYDAALIAEAPLGPPAERPGSASAAVDPLVVQRAVDAATAGPFAQPPASPYLTAEARSAGPPLRVRVPRLRVDARVVPISGQSGVLQPPDDPQVLGWWQEGRAAGAARGTGVVTGHTVHTGGGALDHLGTLAKGDRFTVQTRRGTITYLVLWQHDYPTAEVARQSRRLFAQDGPHRLLLITCSDWNGHGYDSSAVVFARPVGEAPRAAAGATPSEPRKPAEPQTGREPVRIPR